MSYKASAININSPTWVLAAQTLIYNDVMHLPSDGSAKIDLTGDILTTTPTQYKIWFTYRDDDKVIKKLASPIRVTINVMFDDNTWQHIATTIQRQTLNANGSYTDYIYFKPLEKVVKTISLAITTVASPISLLITDLGFQATLEFAEAIAAAVAAETTEITNAYTAAVDAATELITGAKGGNVVIRQDELGQPYEICVMDTKDVTTAVEVWRWNINGFGHSGSGIDGPYDTAITMDGHIVAKFITALTINADQIIAGIIASKDGSVSINLDNGVFQFGNGTDSVTLTKDHVRVDHGTTSHTQMDYTGMSRYNGVTKHNYHYLMYCGSVSNVDTQDAVRIYIPTEFIGTDYKIDWWGGNMFPADPQDLLFSANSEWVGEDRDAGWFEVRASMMVRNPATENTPVWRGKMNILYTIIA